MQCLLLSRQYLKRATKQPEFYIYMDLGYLLLFGLFDDYKMRIFVQDKSDLMRFMEGV